MTLSNRKFRNEKDGVFRDLATTSGGFERERERDTSATSDEEDKDEYQTYCAGVNEAENCRRT